MTDHCPNCRTPRPGGDAPCRECGWMPLRSTEMQFLDESVTNCARCSGPLDEQTRKCPRCGDEVGLEQLSQNTSNFQIFGLLLVTTLLAVCFALARVSLWLGVPAFLILLAAMIRMAVMVRERKRHRYPVLTVDVLRLFGQSLIGVIAAIFVFGVSVLIGGFLLGVFGAMTPGPGTVFVAGAGMLAFAGQLVAIWPLAAKPGNRRWLLLGAAAAAGSGVPTALAIDVLPPNDVFALLLLFPLAAALVPTAGFCCWRGCAERGKSYLVGFSAALCLLGTGMWGVMIAGSEIAAGYAFSGLLIWPSLLTFMTLERVWSWDDAFPAVAGPGQYGVLPRRNPGNQSEPGGGCDNVDDIQFVGEPADERELADGPELTGQRELTDGPELPDPPDPREPLPQEPS